ncbi:ELL-associated factor 1 [Bienertia sinuspersici]
MSMNKKEEPNTAPNPDRWYALTLGSSFKDNQPSSKFCTLRYEFKPASIDKSQPGALHKTKDSKISTSEDYKENDAVLFFDGHSFRLERLHRAVKRLRHVRLPGESAAATLAASSAAEGGSPLLGKAGKAQTQVQAHAYNRGPAFSAPQPQPQPQPQQLPQPQPQQRPQLPPPPPLPPVSEETLKLTSLSAPLRSNQMLCCPQTQRTLIWKNT